MSKLQILSSYHLGVKVFYKSFEEHHQLNDRMNNDGDFRAAPGFVPVCLIPEEASILIFKVMAVSKCIKRSLFMKIY